MFFSVAVFCLTTIFPTRTLATACPTTRVPICTKLRRNVANGGDGCTYAYECPSSTSCNLCQYILYPNCSSSLGYCTITESPTPSPTVPTRSPTTRAPTTSPTPESYAPRSPTASSSSASPINTQLAIIIGASAGGGVVGLALLCLLLYCCCRYRKSHGREVINLDSMGTTGPTVIANTDLQIGVRCEVFVGNKWKAGAISNVRQTPAGLRYAFDGDDGQTTDDLPDTAFRLEASSNSSKPKSAPIMVPYHPSPTSGIRPAPPSSMPGRSAPSSGPPGTKGGPRPKKLCATCGADLDPREVFCSACGQK